MGFGSSEENVLALLFALETQLAKQKFGLDPGAGVRPRPPAPSQAPDPDCHSEPAGRGRAVPGGGEESQRSAKQQQRPLVREPCEHSPRTVPSKALARERSVASPLRACARSYNIPRRRRNPHGNQRRNHRRPRLTISQGKRTTALFAEGEHDWKRATGWTPKEVYAHLAAVAAIIPQLGQGLAAAPEGTDIAQGMDINAMNAQAVGGMASMNFEQVMQAFETNYGKLIDYVKSFPTIR